MAKTYERWQNGNGLTWLVGLVGDDSYHVIYIDQKAGKCETYFCETQKDFESLARTYGFLPG